MQAAPPPEAQVLPETADTMPAGARAAAGPTAARPAAGPKPAHVRPAGTIHVGPQPAALAEASIESAHTASTPDPGAADATVVPRRPAVEDAGRSRTDVPWLGIGSWLLLCGALFASLVGWPDQTALDRVTSIWSGEVPGATLARTPAQGEPAPPQGAPLTTDQQDWSAMTPGPAGQQEALPPTELAPPIRSDAPAETAEPTDGGPPLPRFKPSVDRIAAKFSNAFFEFGDSLQKQGDFEAAVHMRRQGINLDPWKTAGTSDL
jgi:hypothetical protein